MTNIDPPSWHEGAYWPPKAARDAKERAVRHAAGLEGQDATREPHDATEAAQGPIHSGPDCALSEVLIQTLNARVAELEATVARVRDVATQFVNWEASLDSEHATGYADATRIDGQIILAILDAP